jgi:hypothetical protein
MKIKYVALNAFLKEKAPDAAQFPCVVAIALGVAVGRKVPLASSNPEQSVLSNWPTSTFYAEQVMPVVEKEVAEFNENIVIDMDKACRIARAIWMARCGLAHPEMMIDIAGCDEACDPILALSGHANSFAAEDYALLCANKLVIFVMANRITAVMAEDADSANVVEARRS